MTATTITVIWELPVGALPPPPLSVGTGVLELSELVLVDITLDCEVAGVETKVLIGEKDGEGGV